MNTTTITSTMPDTHCPSWCTDNHEPEWQQHVDMVCGTWSIPKADGTVSTHQPEPLEKAAATFEPLHSRQFTVLELDQSARGGVGTAFVAIQQTGGSGEARLFIDAAGEVTPDQAEQLAAALRSAAEYQRTLGNS